MTIRLSTAMRNSLCEAMGFSAIFNKGYIEIYSGSQPVSADAAPTGVLLGVVADSSGAVTREVPATGTIVITGATGQVGGPIATAVGHVLGTSPKTTIELNLRIRNSSVTEFAFTPKRHMLVTYNTLPHLDAPEHASWVTFA